MGTIFEQRERDSRSVTIAHVDGFLAEAVKLAKKHDVSIAEVIAAMDVLERKRRGDLYVANGDAFDEQVAGLGTLLQALSDAVATLAEAVERRSSP